MELNVSKEIILNGRITASCDTNVFLALFQTLQTKNFDKHLGQQVLKATNAIRFNLLQFRPSVLSFVFAVLVYLLLVNVWMVIFVSLNLVAVFTVWNILKFGHTTP